MSKMSGNEQIYVIKASGQTVPFDSNKVEATCIRAGASKKLAEQVVKKVREQLRNGMRTREVYRMVLNALAAANGGQIIKHRYRLKESIMLMGPAGFAFETYVGKILENYGYNVGATRSQVNGKCVKHEIDLVAKSNLTNEKFLIECKYHNFPGIYTGLKESLYTHARFLDLSEVFDSEMLVCNTKVSDDVITYAKCVGQRLLCWRYPHDKGLENMIEEKGLYPITILGLRVQELEALSQNKFMLARDLLTADLDQLSRKTSIAYTRLQRLQNLVRQILR
jgi:hypothetical protein